MIIEFTSDLKKQHIYANGNELAQVMGMDYDDAGHRVHGWPDTKTKHVVTFDNPVLMTDNYRIGTLDPILRDTVFALYASHKKKIIYDITSIEFEQRKFPTVWGPSIDTLLLCKSLKDLKEGWDMEETRKAVEVGSGSGFVSKYLLENNYALEKMVLVDINPEAGKCARQNISDARMKTVTSSGMKYLDGKKFDLIICNPPYIPRVTTVEDNPYEGISLLSDLISNAHRILTKDGMLLLNVSSLCENKALSLIKKMDLDYSKVNKLTVPLKVLNVLNNRPWIDFLSDKVRRECADGYNYWQTLSVYKISRKRL